MVDHQMCAQIEVSYCFPLHPPPTGEGSQAATSEAPHFRQHLGWILKKKKGSFAMMSASLFKKKSQKLTKNTVDVNQMSRWQSAR